MTRDVDVQKTTRSGRARRIDPATAASAAATIFLWASAFAGIRVGLRSYSPEGLALLRYLIAGAALAGYALATRMPMPERRDLPALAFLGFLGFSVYNVALNAGETRVGAGVASFLIASEPLYMAALAVIWRGDRLRRRGWFGMMLSFCGVAVISLSSGDGVSLEPAALLILLAAMVKAGYSVWQKPYLDRYGSLRFVTYAVWLGVAFLLVFLPRLLTEMRAAEFEATVAIVYMGIFPGALGYFAWSYTLARLPASIAGSLLYIIPPVAAAIAWVWLGETPGPLTIVGGTGTLAGVFLVTSRGQARSQPPVAQDQAPSPS